MMKRLQIWFADDLFLQRLRARLPRREEAGAGAGLPQLGLLLPPGETEQGSAGGGIIPSSCRSYDHTIS